MHARASQLASRRHVPWRRCVAAVAIALAVNAEAAAPLAIVPSPAPSLGTVELPLVDWMRRSTLLAGVPGVTAETTALASTTDGFLWVGTYSGLARFDGLEFRSEALPGRADRARISALVADDEALWVGSMRGLARRRRGQWEPVALTEGTAAPWVTAIDVRDHGALAIVGTDAHGAFLVEEGHVRTVQGLPSKRVTSVRLARDGAAVLGTDAGLRVLAPGATEATVEGVPLELRAEPIARIAKDSAGALVVATAERFGRLEAGAFRALGKSQATITALEFAPDGALWLGTIGGGVERRLGAKSSALGTSDGLPQSPVFAFGFDREGGAWVGFEAGGLLQLRPGGARTFDRRAGMPHDLVWSIGEARGALWFATKGGGVLEQAPDGARHLWAPSTGFPSTESLPPVEDGAGGLWFATYGQGVFRWRGDDHVDLFGPRDGLPNVFTYAAHRTRDGALWVGTRSGVARFDGERFVVPEALAPLASERVRTIAEAPEGSRLDGLWFGSNRILSRYVRGQLTRWNLVDDLHLDELQGIAFLGDGSLVLATSGTGLVRFDGTRALRVGSAHGLVSDYFYGLAEDAAGRVWATSNAGVQFVDRRALTAAFDAVAAGSSPTIDGARAVDTRDGLATAQCYAGVSPNLTIAHDGIVWAPTASGAVRIDPAHLFTAPLPPIVRVDGVRIDDTDVPEGPIQVPSSSKTVEFAFGATTYTAPTGVRFRYRLKGLDDRWVEVGALARSARFTDLPGGREYVFEVVAAQSRGTFGEHPASVRIFRQPHFHETWSARLLGVALVGGVAVAIARSRERTLRVRADELELQVRARTRDLAKRTQSLDDALRDLRGKDALLRSDLALARDFVERSRSHEDRIEGVRLAAIDEPLDVVGGDVWFAHAHTPRQLRLLLADTTGHGVQASMRALVLQHEFAQIVGEAPSPADALARLDARLVSRYPDLELRTTAIVADVVTHEAGGATAYLSFAGCPPAFHLAQDGSAREVQTMDGFLGVDAAARRRSTRVDLAPGEGLVLFTDGLSEAKSPLGEVFGEDRMREAIEGRGEPEARLARLMANARAFVGEGGFDDDVTVLLLTVR